jgi:hypothetical protein
MTSIQSASRPIFTGDPFTGQVLRNRVQFDEDLREAGPIVWLEQYDVWATGRFDVVDAIFRDHSGFSSASGTGLLNIKKDKNWRKPSVILDTDPPDHTRIRSIMAKVLSPGAVRRLKSTFVLEADRLVDSLLDRGEFDAAADLAEKFPFTMLPNAVGMAQEGREHLLPYSAVNFNAMGPRNSNFDRAVANAEGSAEHVAWQVRRDALSDSGLGADIYAAVDAGELTEDEGALLVRTFLSAGIDTTIYGIGLALHALMENPEQWRILRETPALARHAFEETLRFTPPSPTIARTTSASVEMNDVRLGEAEKVVLFIGAANRDPRRFEQPEMFDITRQASGNLAFGAGLHACVGQLMARMEAECVLGAVARKISRLELIGEPVAAENNWLRGFDSLPVRATRA